MLKAFLERRRIRKTLERFLGPNLAGQIADAGVESPQTMNRERNIDVVFISFAVATAASYIEHTRAVADLAGQFGSFIHALSPIVICTFNEVGSGSPSQRRAFVDAVQCRIPGAASIVHGSVFAHLGPFGSSERLDFGFWWPGVIDAFRLLATLAPGHSHELAAVEQGR